MNRSISARSRNLKQGWSGRAVGICSVALLFLAPAPSAEAQFLLGLGRTLYVESTESTSDACDDLRAALASVDDGGGLLGLDRYTVRLGPGVFDCGSEPVFVPEFVTLVGQGPWTTTIRGTVDSQFSGVLHLLGHSEVRQLRVLNLRATASSGVIAISAFKLGKATNNIFLRDVQAGTPQIAGPALYAVDAVVEIHNSRFADVVELEGGSTFFFFSHLLSGVSKTNSAAAMCGLTLGPGMAQLTEFCDTPP